MDFFDLLNQPGTVLLDGGLGTMLTEQGLPADIAPELAAITHPQLVTAIHRQYVQAGAQIVCANTFRANRYKLAASNVSVEQVIRASIAAAREAAGGKALVAMDIGPIGQLLEPVGNLPFAAALEAFAEEVRCAVDAGADLIFIETMTDLQECRAALLAAKENCDLPVIASMTYEANGRTFLGSSARSAALTLEALGADVIGVNCSLGPREMPALVEELREWTNLPLSIKPNAGLPDPATGGYDITAREFAVSMAKLSGVGVKLMGGCCGTTPEYISLLKAELAKCEFVPYPRHVSPAVCSATTVVPLDGVRVVGERLNPTGKKLMKEALKKGDMDYLLAQALSQCEAGADILDLNVGLPELDEAALMQQAIRSLSGLVDAPLQIDSTDPVVIEQALRLYCGKAIVNSVGGDDETLDAILPIVKKYGAAVIGLTLDKRGIPATAADRLAIARHIAEKARSYGIPKSNLIIDCLTLTVSAQPEAAAATVDAVEAVRRELGLQTTLGVSNISFGLPCRPLVNRNFLMMALTKGLNLPIINPNDADMMAAVRCYRLLTQADPDGRDYIAAYADAAPGSLTTQAAAPLGTQAVQRDLQALVTAGIAGEAEAAARELLQKEGPMQIVDSYLIPALDAVGAEFEAGRVFLPQLIQAAGAAQAAFGAIRESLSSSDTSASRGTVVLATVKGDIHDIGKNIVKVLLENYGYNVVDLGKDVEPQAVVEAVKKHQAPLVGLSALMTTTLKSMAATIELLHAEVVPCRVVVGGAVLTPDYAESIKADFYAKDAKATVDIAKQLMG